VCVCVCLCVCVNVAHALDTRVMTVNLICCRDCHIFVQFTLLMFLTLRLDINYTYSAKYVGII